MLINIFYLHDVEHNECRSIYYFMPTLMEMTIEPIRRSAAMINQIVINVIHLLALV